jgi:hypothetical protein
MCIFLQQYPQSLQVQHLPRVAQNQNTRIIKFNLHAIAGGKASDRSYLQSMLFKILTPKSTIIRWSAISYLKNKGVPNMVANGPLSGLSNPLSLRYVVQL